jgi:hypothetical protein
MIFFGFSLLLSSFLIKIHKKYIEKNQQQDGQKKQGKYANTTIF